MNKHSRVALRAAALVASAGLVIGTAGVVTAGEGSSFKLRWPTADQATTTVSVTAEPEAERGDDAGKSGEDKTEESATTTEECVCPSEGEDAAEARENPTEGEPTEKDAADSAAADAEGEASEKPEAAEDKATEDESDSTEDKDKGEAAEDKDAEKSEDKSDAEGTEKAEEISETTASECVCPSDEKPAKSESADPSEANTEKTAPRTEVSTSKSTDRKTLKSIPSGPVELSSDLPRYI